MPLRFVKDSDRGSPIGVIASLNGRDEQILSIANIDDDEDREKMEIGDFFVDLLRYSGTANKLFNQYLSSKQINKIKEDLELGIIPKEAKMRQFYNKVIEEYDRIAGRSIRVHEPSKLIPLFPPQDGKINQLLITGISGAGKSRLAALIIRKHMENFPISKVYLFTSLEEDPSIDDIIGVENIERILMDESLLDFDDSIIEPDSIVIFDDVEGVNKSRGMDPKTADNIVKKLIQIRDVACKTFRHKGVQLLINIVHDAMAYKATKTLNLESNALIFFNKTGNHSQLERLLTTHWGLDKEQCKMLFDLPDSSWVMYSRKHPNFAMWRAGAIFI
jgi:hypothetical protein